MDNVITADVSNTSTKQLFALGDYFYNPATATTYRYVHANGATSQYGFVSISTDGLFEATPLTTTTNASTNPLLVGAAQCAFADDEYGWVAVKGYFTGNFAASCVQDVKIYTTATAGVVDDASTTLINGLKLITTITTAASAPCFACAEMTTAAA